MVGVSLDDVIVFNYCYVHDGQSIDTRHECEVNDATEFDDQFEDVHMLLLGDD